MCPPLRFSLRAQSPFNPAPGLSLQLWKLLSCPHSRVEQRVGRAGCLLQVQPRCHPRPPAIRQERCPTSRLETLGLLSATFMCKRIHTVAHTGRHTHRYVQALLAATTNDGSFHNSHSLSYTNCFTHHWAQTGESCPVRRGTPGTWSLCFTLPLHSRTMVVGGVTRLLLPAVEPGRRRRVAAIVEPFKGWD